MTSMLVVFFRRLWLALVVLLLVSAFIGLIWATIVRNGQVYLGAYLTLFADSGFVMSLVHSLVLSAMATVVTISLAVPTVYIIYMSESPVLSLIEWLTLLPFVIPGVSLAIGYVTVFSNNFLPLVGTPDLLPFAFSLLGLPFFYRAYVNSLQSGNVRQLAEVAATLGAGRLETFFVVVPSLMPGIVSGAILVFALSMGEFAITQLTAGGEFLTFPVYMNSIFMYNPDEGAAMAVLSFLITWLAVGLVAFVIPLMTRGDRISRPGRAK